MRQSRESTAYWVVTVSVTSLLAHEKGREHCYLGQQSEDTVGQGAYVRVLGRDSKKATRGESRERAGMECPHRHNSVIAASAAHLPCGKREAYPPPWWVDFWVHFLKNAWVWDFAAFNIPGLPEARAENQELSIFHIFHSETDLIH